MDAVAQDIKERTEWTIAVMEQQAEQALRQTAEQKQSGWAVMEELATMYGQQKALSYRKKFVKELEYGLPVGEAVESLLNRVEDDTLMWAGTRSTSTVANAIADKEHAALLVLVKELRNAQQHIARSAAVTEGLGTGVLTQKQ